MSWYNHIGIALGYVVILFVLLAIGGDTKGLEEFLTVWIALSVIAGIIHFAIFLATL